MSDYYNQHYLDWKHAREKHFAAERKHLNKRDSARRVFGEERPDQVVCNWSERICEPGRVYDACSNQAGEIVRSLSDTPAIAYNRVTGRWEAATIDSPVTRQNNLVKQVKQDTKERMGREVRAINRHNTGSF